MGKPADCRIAGGKWIRSACLKLFLMTFLLTVVHAFDVHLSEKRNTPGNVVFNCSLRQRRRYTLDTNTTPYVSEFLHVDSKTGAVQMKTSLRCADGTIRFYIQAKKISLRGSMIPVIDLPVVLHLEGHICSDSSRKHGPEWPMNVVVKIPTTISKACWRKSQAVLDLSDLVPLSIKKCDLIFLQPKNEKYVLEPHGGHLVASEEFCETAPFWNLEFSVKITCPNQLTYEQLIRVYFEVGLRDQHMLSSRDRLRRSIHNQPPYFSETLYKVTIPEELEGGYIVSNVSAIDPEGGQLSYSLHAVVDSRSQRLFHIDEQTGQVQTTTHLDREFIDAHFLKITATDDGTPPRSGTTTLQVIVGDRNDHAPIFEQATYVTSVRELSPVGSTVVTVRATDQDIEENARLEYSLVNLGGNNNYFKIDPVHGIISTAEKLDREDVAFYTVLVQATDFGVDPERKSAVATVEITVLDDNDNYPQFTERTYIADVSEDTDWRERPVIATVKAQDSDIGINAAIRYAIIGGNTQGNFVIDSQSGEISVVSALDYENVKSYRLIIRAQDGGQPTRSNTTNVILRVLDANDNDPKFYISVFQESVSENAIVGTSVMKVEAYDADSGVNAEIMYSIKADSSFIPFTIDPLSGTVLTTSNLDRETHSVYDFLVTAKDRGIPFRSSTAIVSIRVQDINDNDPVFDPKIYEATVLETDPPGTPVIGVTATDEDEEPRIMYHISDGNDRERFSIIHQDKKGLISVAQPLDYRTDKHFTLTVTATDTGGRFDTATVYINVTDANTHRPTFTKTPYVAKISEDATIGTIVLVVEAVDLDIGENSEITYSIESNPEFDIDPRSGAIILKESLDREQANDYVLVVTASDHGVPQLSDTTNVEIEVTDVNDNYPIFHSSSYAVSIREDALIGSSVVQVSALDKDSGLNGQVRYTFSGGEDGDSAFIVEPTSGIIRSNQLLDREYVSKYKLSVYAVDRGSTPLSSSATIMVNVEDVNDNPPSFDADSIKMFISENSPIGSTVGEIHASDPDDGPNGDIQYGIVGGPDAEAFGLISRHPKPAELITKIDLDYETNKKKYMVIVRASSPPLRTDVEVEIWVTDVNDNAPVLSNFIIVFNHHKNYFPGKPIGRVPAYDADVTDKLRYKFTAGNNANLLLLNEKTGEMTLSPNLDTNVPIHAAMEVSVFGEKKRD